MTFFDITQVVYDFMINAYRLFQWSFTIDLGGDIGFINVSIFGALSITLIIGVIIAKLIALVIPN